MIKKKKLQEASIPTSSMADIAFLLLLFFLVATVIDVDTGLGLTLPEYVPPEEQVTVKVDPERMAAVLVNEQGDVLIDGEIVSIFQIKEKIKPRIMSKVDLPFNKKLIVSLKTDRKTVYNQYIAALDQIKLAFFEARDAVSESEFGKKFKNLSQEQQELIKDKVPIIISLAEPELIK
ncbi:biopolymer transporter ExbD [Ignavibacterium sp.]|uniref:ExbD/TolR family protein n=1 Tax=Ignavibacterium sp. TaxID=2651167 RepID=UPI00307FBB37